MALRKKVKVVRKPGVGEELEILFESLGFVPTSDKDKASVLRIKEIAESLK